MNTDCERAEALAQSCAREAEALAKETGRCVLMNGELEALVQRVGRIVDKALAAGEEAGKGANTPPSKLQKEMERIEKENVECRARIGELESLGRALDAGVQRIKVVEGKSDRKEGAERRSGEKDKSITMEALEAQVSELERALDKLEGDKDNDMVEKVNALLTAKEPVSCSFPPLAIAPRFQGFWRVLDSGLTVLGEGANVIVVRLLCDALETLSREQPSEGEESESTAILFQTLIDKVLRTEGAGRAGAVTLSIPDPLDLPDPAVEWLARHKLLRGLIRARGDQGCRTVE